MTEFATNRRSIAQWVQSSPLTQPNWKAGAWTVGDARIVETQADAVGALAARPLGGMSIPLPRGDLIGRVLFLAGRLEDAEAQLNTTANDCGILENPIASVRAALYLGQAREQRGNQAGACAAYSKVLDRWGHARPRSVTADQARAAMARLRCGSRRP